MSREKNVYEALARKLCEEFQKKQSASLLANLNKRNMDALDVSKNKILADVSEELLGYRDENNRSLEEEEKALVLDLIKKELYIKDIDIDAGEQETCVRSRLNRLSTPMNTYSQELVDLITIKTV